MKLTEITPIPDTVEELFTKYPQIWTRGEGHNGLFDEQGNVVEEYKDATCLCLGAAIGFVVKKGEPFDSVLHDDAINTKSKRAIETINRRYREHYLTIPQWNDEVQRTFSEVLSVAREAGI